MAIATISSIVDQARLPLLVIRGLTTGVRPALMIDSSIGGMKAIRGTLALRVLVPLTFNKGGLRGVWKLRVLSASAVPPRVNDQ